MLLKRTFLFFVFALLFCAGCDAPRTKEASNQMSVYDGGFCFTEDGVVYQSPEQGGATGYFDYKTGKYMPLCAKSNCLHDSLECQAVYLREYADFIGRIGNQWYYYVTGGWEEERGFHSCDLDGGNDKFIGDFPYVKGDGVVLFYDQECVLCTWDAKADWEEEQEIINSNFPHQKLDLYLEKSIL